MIRAGPEDLTGPREANGEQGQMSKIPASLPQGVTAYSRSPDFTPETLPAKLQSAHAIKTGTWALLHVLEGRVRYCLEAPHEGEVVDSAGEHVVIQENMPHHVSFVEPGRFFIEFYRTIRP